MAGVREDRLNTDVADVATDVSPMSRLKTLARPEVARPEGFERTPPTFVIEGVEALVDALRAA
jgi:hypothetical protein